MGGYLGYCIHALAVVIEGADVGRRHPHVNLKDGGEDLGGWVRKVEEEQAV